jgi:hypothetical protein
MRVWRGCEVTKWAAAVQWGGGLHHCEVQGQGSCPRGAGGGGGLAALAAVQCRVEVCCVLMWEQNVKCSSCNSRKRWTTMP